MRAGRSITQSQRRQSAGRATGTGCVPRSRMACLFGRLALASFSLGAIGCASQPAEATPAAAPERPAEAPAHAAAPHRPEEQAPPAPPSEPPASSTPTSESPAPSTPASELPASPPPAPESAPAEPAPAAEPSRKLEVVARLVEPKSTAGCGIFHFVVVMRYEIIEVIEGTYGERELYAAHSCPEMGAARCRDAPGKGVRRFKAGDVHHMRLDQRSRGGLLLDLFTDKRLPRYRATCASLVPPESP